MNRLLVSSGRCFRYVFPKQFGKSFHLHLSADNGKFLNYFFDEVAPVYMEGIQSRIVISKREEGTE
jgi:hypothetical protein